MVLQSGVPHADISPRDQLLSQADKLSGVHEICSDFFLGSEVHEPEGQKPKVSNRRSEA